jgi:hypothetical protein
MVKKPVGEQSAGIYIPAGVAAGNQNFGGSDAKSFSGKKHWVAVFMV